MTVSGECRLYICEQLLRATTIPAQAQAIPEHEEEGNDSEVKTECPPHPVRPGILRCNPNSLRCQTTLWETRSAIPRIAVTPPGAPQPRSGGPAFSSRAPHLPQLADVGLFPYRKKPAPRGRVVGKPFQGKGESASLY